MVRVLITFSIHRLVLFVLALIVLAFNLPFPRSGFLPAVSSFSSLWAPFSQKVSDADEMRDLTRVRYQSTFSMLKETRKPFIWVSKWLVNLTGIPPLLALIFLSNLFFILFLSELISLLGKLVISDLAYSTTILLVLWPTSYELSLGSELSLTCFLVLASVRFAIENRWLFSGLSLGLLSFYEPMVFGLIPFLGYFFWYFQRHFYSTKMIQNGCFFLLPSLVVIIWGGQGFGQFMHVMSNSALFNLFQTGVGGKSFSWTFSHSILGQTLAILFFVLGAVLSALYSSLLLHRLIPIVMLVLTLLFSTYGMVASRAPLAGICLHGLAGSSRHVTKLIELVFILLGFYEVYGVFK